MIPHGIYCYDENGVCPYYMKLGTIVWSKNPVAGELLCKYHSQCSECTKCQSQVVRCEKLDFTDFDESTLLWDKCKECSFNYDSDEEYNLVDRNFQEIFDKLLSCGFDAYGRIEDEELEKKYLKIKENIEHIHYFDNGTFMINPYYWGDDEELINFPNFIYYPTGLKLHWYKYPLRAGSVSRPIHEEEFEEMINDCIRSLRK